MFGKILAILAAVVGVVAIIAVFQPDDFKIERATSTSASQSAVFAQVNDFHKWEAWSPWEKMDPAMKRTFEGPETGVGAIYSWEGNSKVGQGKMTLTQSKSPELIQIQLDFLKPMKATNMTEFTFKKDGRRTLVTWSMTGKRNFIAKIFCLFMNMDKVVGGDFDRGLEQLKVFVESAKKK